MSRTKGSKNKNVNETRNILQKINARIKAAEKKFITNTSLDDATKKRYMSTIRDRLKKIVPNSDYITDSGLLKVGMKYSEEELQVLKNKMPPTVSKMMKGAQKVLENEDKDFIGPPKNPMSQRVITEIQARLEYESTIENSDLNPYESQPDDWKDLMNTLKTKRPDILAIDPNLVDRIENISDALEDIGKGSSYTKALEWVDEFNSIRSVLSSKGVL